MFGVSSYLHTYNINLVQQVIQMAVPYDASVSYVASSTILDLYNSPFLFLLVCVVYVFRISSILDSL